MSKAFTSEDAGVPEPPVKRDTRLAPGARPFTPDGLAALRSRVETLRAQGPSADLAALDALLKVAVAVPAPVGDSRVAFGSWVDVEDGEGKRASYRVVGPDEADPRAGLVSVESPLAKAFVGKHVGDEVELELPKATRSFTVLRIR